MSEPQEGRFAYEGLERVFHEKARLGILTSLNTHAGGLLFSDLKDLCLLTDGNLNRHLKVLQEERLIELWKGFQNNRPQTLCRITKQGHERFLHYIGELERVVSDAALATGAKEPRSQSPPLPKLSEGWTPA